MAYQSQRKQKIAIPITIQSLESCLQYLISVKAVSRKFLRNIEKLLDAIDRRPYERDDYQIFVLNAIDFVTGLREQGSNNLNYIKQAMEQSDLPSELVYHLYSNLEINIHDMSKEEYDHLSGVISMYVDYVSVFESRPAVMEAYDELMNPPTGKPSVDTIKTIRELFEKTLSNIRIADISRDDEQSVAIDFQNPEKSKNDIYALHEELTDPSNIFVTGIKELNRFLNGGFERKRMYIFYGPTNNYKSIMLLNCCLWILKYNSQMKPKFPNKKLAVVLVTLENSKNETMDRMHSLETSGNVDATQLSDDVYYSQWEDILHRINSNFEFHIVYKNSINTTTEDIKATIEEIEEDNNLEVAAVIVDHLGNIKKLDKSVDDRKGLINSAYELSHWGKMSDRAVITAMHTNSDFDSKLAEYRDAGKTNLVRYMGGHTISEAKYIEKAVDQSIFILKEQSNVDGEMYLGFKYDKMRKKRSQGSNIFYHRLYNGICLLDDEFTTGSYSIPCMPGTETGLQQRQMAMQYGTQKTGETMPYTTPFAGSPQQSSQGQWQPGRYQPVQVAINQGTGFTLGTQPEELEVNEHGVDDFEEILDTAIEDIMAGSEEEEFTENDFSVEEDTIVEEIANAESQS